jgi:superfamily II DNA or RNA helicase
MSSGTQLNLGIPETFSIKLDKPLFFRNEKIKYGVITKIALQKGQHILKAIHKEGKIYEIVDSLGSKFLAELLNKKGAYNFKGNAQSSISDAGSDDFRINGTGLAGESLRKAQTGAVYALLSHWSLSQTPATVVLPTGTGKTETMFVTALADKATKTLVIVPTIDLKKQTADKFSTWGILRRLGVISGSTQNPTVMVLNSTVNNVNKFDSVEVIITTPALIARAKANIKEKLRKSFSHVFFDEAHHIEASEWKELKSLFKSSKIVQFTATPYRNDRKPVEGKIVYNYPLSEALNDECFSKISLISIDQRHPKLKDKAIADAAVNKLNEDRKNGWSRHKVMVRTEKRDHADYLLLKYKEWFPKERVVAVHSNTKRKKEVIEQIKNGEYDIIICVDMLKEGFDFPDFKIAAVHKLHKSLGVLLQFIGRFARTQSGLGDASFIVNFADENLSIELENLFQEGTGWENVISEIADARKADAESLLAFLQGCEPYSGFDSPNIELNPKLVYPALSCVCFRCDKVDWKNFRDAFNTNIYALSHPYFNKLENVFYFTTQKREKVKWARTDKMRDQTWDLIVMHFDSRTKLLYVGYSEKLLDVKTLVRCLTAKEPTPLNGDCVFRSFDSIKRLSIVHAGIFKPANHLHRYSRLSGADVTTELTKWKEGKRCQKSDFVGIGFRDGFPVSVGASVKGKIWSPARVGDLKEWKSWCLKIGKLITDEAIDSNQLLEDSAEKIQLEKYPGDLVVLATDWSEVLYDRIHKLSIPLSASNSIMLSECTIKCKTVNDNSAEFVLYLYDQMVEFTIRLGGEKGHNVEGLDDTKLTIEGLRAEPLPLKRFFEEHPPTMFLMNGCTIAGSILTNYNVSTLAKIPKERIEKLDWQGVVFQNESMFKKGIKRDDSIQEYVMKLMKAKGAQIVFNDDNSGESADIVAVFHEENLIRFKLIHCKYSKNTSGSRLQDLYEVCGQAIVSLRYKWKPEELLKHMERRNGTGVLKGRRFYAGDNQEIERIRKALRYTDVQFEFAIAQPGVAASDINDEMMTFLGSVYSTVVEMTETQLKCYFSK